MVEAEAEIKPVDRLVIKTNRWKYFWLLLISCGFVAAGVIIILDSRQHQSDDIWIGWTTLLFFGSCAVIFVWQIIETRPRLIIDEHGIRDRTLGVGLIPWSEIEGAYIRSISGNDFICLELHSPERWVSKLSPIGRALATTNAALGFSALNLNLSGVDARAEEVFELVLKRCELHRRQNN